MTEFKAVIFDLDGTLYDNSHIARKLIVRSLLNLRLISSERACRHALAGQFLGSEAYDKLFSTMSAKAGCSPEKARTWFWNTYLPLQAKVLRQSYHRKPWVDETLADLRKKGVKVACFSDYGMVEEKLRALGIDPASFDVIADAPSAGGLKPCKESFLRIAKMLGTEPQDTLVVGDREDTDGAGAAAAGMMYMKVCRQDQQSIVLKRDN